MNNLARFSALDALYYDRRRSLRRKLSVFEIHAPRFQVVPYDLGGDIAIQSGNWKALPTQVAHDGENVAAGTAGEPAGRLLIIGTDDQVQRQQTRAEYSVT